MAVCNELYYLCCTLCQICWLHFVTLMVSKPAFDLDRQSIAQCMRHSRYRMAQMGGAVKSTDFSLEAFVIRLKIKIKNAVKLLFLLLYLS